MTEQERKQNTFNIVKNHLLTMNNPCNSEDGNDCRYRNGKEKDNRCAIGILIPDKLYKSTCEGANPRTLISKHEAHYLKGLKAYWVKNGISTDTLFLTQLQSIHDDFFITKENHLESLAGEYDLNY